MPLPPAPTKRAAMLPPEAFDAPARSSHKAARKTEAPAADEAMTETESIVVEHLRHLLLFFHPALLIRHNGIMGELGHRGQRYVRT